MYADSVVPCVRTALNDPSPAVRKVAGTTFDALCTAIGNKALDDVVSPLLAQIVSGRTAVTHRCRARPAASTRSTACSR